MNITWFYILTIISFIWPVSGAGENQRPNILFVLADEWETEALPIGNGRLGAMVFGGGTERDQAPRSVVRIECYQMADGSGVAVWDEYTCKGGTETWRANFGRHTSFKTLRVSGITGSPRSADCRPIVTHTAADVAGSFACSNPLLNDIFEMSGRSARTQAGLCNASPPCP